MHHNRYFQPSREPLKSHKNLHLYHASGPFLFFNPTCAIYTHAPKTEKEPPESIPRGEKEHYASKINFQWRSRDNRKGRHTLVVDPSLQSDAHYVVPKTSLSLQSTAKGILRMCTLFPYWDISYLVALSFTLGSIVWVLNAFFVYLPLVQPETEFRNEITVAGGVTAFVGATIFEIGSVLLMFEAVNENRVGCFGWAVERILGGSGKGIASHRVIPSDSSCMHHHTNKKNLVGRSDGMIISFPSALVSMFMPSSVQNLSLDSHLESPFSSENLTTNPSDNENRTKTWVWFPSIHELTDHYLRELGFLASFFQFCGATIFWISGFTALPGINNKLSQRLLDGVYWTPQIVGGTGFIFSRFIYIFIFVLSFS